MLNNLHKMILATKTSKQKKIMTFQYLHVNSETGENLYGNAGACSPFLIRPSENIAVEIKMAGAALGAFKRAVYTEMALDFRPGDAIVFYTDGIVECKNQKGEMLGYERLKTTLLQCWDANPEIYYNNILKAYYEYVGDDAEAGDDLTFVILVYNEKKEIIAESPNELIVASNT
jgi:sigma-B regulation protein RsbU (phosphoserine phosphatase)